MPTWTTMSTCLGVSLMVPETLPKDSQIHYQTHPSRLRSRRIFFWTTRHTTWVAEVPHVSPSQALLVLQIGNEGMTHFITMNHSPSNPQQPIHSAWNAPVRSASSRKQKSYFMFHPSPAAHWSLVWPPWSSQDQWPLRGPPPNCLRSKKRRDG